MKRVLRLHRSVWLFGLMAACGGKADRKAESLPVGGAAPVASAGQAGTSTETAGAPAVAGSRSAGMPPSPNEGGAGDAGAAGENASGDGGQAGTTSWTPDAPRSLTAVAKAPEWYGKDETQAQGLLIAPDGRVFFETTNKIYEIAGVQVRDYLTDVETQAAVGNQDGYGFGGLGFDQQGTLYATYGGSMIRSSAPHQLELWRAEVGSAMAPALSLSVLGQDDVLASSTDGMWRVTAQTTATLLKSFSPLDEPCVFPKVSLAASGTFMVLRDCASKRVERGHFDGAAVLDLGTWFDGTFSPSGTASPVDFLCGTSDLQGGFYLTVRANKTKQLYHLTESATESTGVSEIAVTPSLDDAAAMADDSQAFHGCNITAAPGGVIYLQSSMELWKLAVQP